MVNRDQKIRVAMLGAYPSDTSHIWGGVEAAYANLVKGLLETGCAEIHILTMRPPASTGEGSHTQGDLTFHLLPPYPRFERLRGYATYQKTINEKLAQIRPDLVHAQDAGSDALVAVRSAFPAVVTVHGIRWQDGKHYTSLSKRLRHFYDSLITERYVIRHARHLIACSPYVTRYFKNMMRRDIGIFHIPNAIDNRFFQNTEQPDAQVVLFAGRVIPRKRVMDLVQAFAKVHQNVPGAHLHIAGETSTEPGYVESIRRLARQANIADHIHFLGPLSEDAILREFAGCSLLALPSAQETAPLTISQAMAAGKPVVATRVGGVADMVGEDGTRGFLTNVGNVAGLAAAMARLLQDAELRVKMGQCGREYALENHHMNSVARRTVEAYQYIADKEHRGIG